MPSFNQVGPAPTISRLPTSPELAAINNFAHHASHCSTCAHPLDVLLLRENLCRRGNKHARELARHLYSRNGKVYSIFEEGNGPTVAYESCRVRVTMPRGCEAVSDVLRAIEGGMRIKKSHTTSEGKRTETTALISYAEPKPKKERKTEYWIEKRRPAAAVKVVAVNKGKTVTTRTTRASTRPAIEIVEPPSATSRRREEKVVYIEDSGRGYGYGYGHGGAVGFPRHEHEEQDDLVLYAAPREGRMGRFGGNIVVQ